MSAYLKYTPSFGFRCAVLYGSTQTLPRPNLAEMTSAKLFEVVRMFSGEPGEDIVQSLDRLRVAVDVDWKG
ncbi:MAG: hypothetical protein AAGJ80_16540 [Cyanobacteria bacterium J06553_1]